MTKNNNACLVKICMFATPCADFGPALLTHIQNAESNETTYYSIINFQNIKLKINKQKHFIYLEILKKTY